MATPFSISVRRSRLRPDKSPAERPTAVPSPAAIRFVLIAALVAAVMIGAPRGSSQAPCSNQSKPDCPAIEVKTELVFILDRSGSMAKDQAGQSYNVQVEGVLRALRDPTVIPRGGSVAVAVETFTDAGRIEVPLTQINSAADAEAVAAIVETLRCDPTTCDPVGPCPVFGPIPASNFVAAINTAADHLRRNSRSGTRQVLFLSSDGQSTDKPKEEIERAVNKARDEAMFRGIKLEVIFLTFGPPPEGLPDNTLMIKGPCNEPCASFDTDNCKDQIRQFVEHVRTVFRSNVTQLNLEVTTNNDTEPGAAVSLDSRGTTLRSLRQAIEEANIRGGNATITFAESVLNMTIRPTVPLPAITQPDITIDGCEGTGCVVSITIDGASTDTAKGERHCNGILIRSNRNVVRGLKIVNFMGAGIAVEPVCPSDNVGFNRIERNVLENNKKAGVCVLDPPPGQASAVIHNIGNTILSNNIIGSATPIDLGGDGRTDNDLCDTDEGPNTLLNFPRITAVTRSAGSVTVMGTVCDPNCAEKACPANLIGAVVEIFAVTEFSTNSANQATNRVTSAQGDHDNRVITGVMFLARGIIDADGSFTISSLPDLPTYTATVTDREGNTSELMFSCAGFAQAEITPETIVFDAITARGQSRKVRKQPSRTFTIENTGCAQLNLTLSSILRTSSDVTGGLDDRNLYSVAIINSAGAETAFPPNTTILILQGQMVTFRVRFNPVIPPVTAPMSMLSANEILPDEITSELTFNHNGFGKSKVTITGRVRTEVQLINPNGEQPRKPPLVTLTRSGDELEARFFVFDSNGDVQRASYEFRDNAGNIVPLDNCCADLTAVQREYTKGQSFVVRQKFSNAKEHPEVATIQVTVCDKQMQCAMARSGQIVISGNTASAQSLRQIRTSKLILSSTEIALEAQRVRPAPVTRRLARPGSLTNEIKSRRERRNKNDKKRASGNWLMPEPDSNRRPSP